ncbi:hypothetical protein E2C01_060299 [Portunus trituberculatus]|uniref:Uncharacterized protein n=1 Tax=Portunus trituberculatus TaxID=210409 RepID=A0A5B7HBN8_PORTR|nr:hypothetical protein [Portunus trituberculatus]
MTRPSVLVTFSCSVTVRSVTLSDCLLALLSLAPPLFGPQRRKQIRMPSVFLSAVDVRTANIPTIRPATVIHKEASQTRCQR